MRNTVKVLAVLFALAALGVSCATYEESSQMLSFTEAPLMGMVYDLEQSPCPDAQLTVDGQPGPLTDINGRFVIPLLTRGTHKVTVTKDGFETVDISMDFLNRGQVLYMRMSSMSQLLSKAEDALAKGDLQLTDELLKRADALKTGNPVSGYLRAIYLLKGGDPKAAVAALKDLVAKGVKYPAVYLELADISQYRLEDNDQAVTYLREYLKLSVDPAVQDRLNKLTAPAPVPPASQSDGAVPPAPQGAQPATNG